MFLPKSLGRVKAFRKNCLGGSPYFGFYCVFINKCFEICLRGILYLPSSLPPPTSPPPLCASMNNSKKLSVDLMNERIGLLFYNFVTAFLCDELRKPFLMVNIRQSFNFCLYYVNLKCCSSISIKFHFSDGVCSNRRASECGTRSPPQKVSSKGLGDRRNLLLHRDRHLRIHHVRHQAGEVPRRLRHARSVGGRC
jgi:hypothetical protein